MKPPTLIRSWRQLTCALLLFAYAAHGEEKNDLKAQPYFQHLLGEWKGEGDLKGADGNNISIKEEWKAFLEGDNTMIMEGKRQINGDTQSFKWTIIRNASTGTYEATHQARLDVPDTQRFEVSLPDGALQIEISGLIGSGDAKLTIVETFTGKDANVLESKVNLTNEQGVSALSGMIKHERIKKP